MVLNLVQEVRQFVTGHVLVVEVLLIVVLRVAIEDSLELLSALLFLYGLTRLPVKLLLSDALKPVGFLGWLLSCLGLLHWHLLDLFLMR